MPRSPFNQIMGMHRRLRFWDLGLKGLGTVSWGLLCTANSCKKAALANSVSLPFSSLRLRSSS